MKACGKRSEVLVVEAVCSRQTRNWVKEKGRSKVIMESECLVLIQSVNSQANFSSQEGVIIQDCKDTIKDSQ